MPGGGTPALAPMKTPGFLLPLHAAFVGILPAEECGKAVYAPLPPKVP